VRWDFVLYLMGWKQAFEQIRLRLPSAVDKTEDAIKFLRAPQLSVFLLGKLPEPSVDCHLGLMGEYGVPND
jgi:hypothetical protein